MMSTIVGADLQIHMRYFCQRSPLEYQCMSDITLLDDHLIRAYLRHAIDALGVDATNLARRAGLNPSTLTRILSDNPRSGSLRRSTLEAISRVSGVPIPAELAGSPNATPPTSAGVGLVRDVPVHALIAAPADHLYYWNQTVVDYAPRPPGIARATRVFAVRAPDDLMDGWRRAGELIYIDPTRAVAEGDHALVEVANSASPNNPSLYFIRRMARRRADAVTLGTWGHDPKETIYPRRDVLSFLRVLEWPELLGT